MVPPKMFFFESLDGGNIIPIFDKKVFRYIWSKVLTRLPLLVPSLMAYLLFRVLSIGFGLFISKEGEESRFYIPGPKLIDLNEKVKS